MAGTMNYSMEVAETIREQLGGGRFVVMTGAKHFLAIDNGLRFTIPRNMSKANRVEIVLNDNDLYDIRFIYYRAGRIDIRTGKTISDKREIIKAYDDVFCDQLQELFTSVTGMYTHF